MNFNGFSLINKLKLLLCRITNKIIDCEDITEFNSEQYLILKVLWFSDGISMTELSEETGLAINTLSIMLDNMEKRELIFRRSCSADKRKKRVYLTEKIKILKTSSFNIDNNLKKIFYKNFSNKEIEEFEMYLKRVIQNINEEDNK